MSKFYIGIDPGKDGGIACLSPDNKLTLHKIPLIGKEADLQGIRQILMQYINNGNCVFGLEDVKPFPGVSAMSMGKLMEIKGIKQGILVAMEVPYIMVAPKTWQATAWSGVPVQKKSTGKNDTKATSLLAARRLFPSETFLATERSKVAHDGLVDAALIAHHLKSLNS
jgi:hypothetical protein